MTPLDAIRTLETDENATEDEILAAWQYLIDTGLVWQLQGFYGRTAARLIDAGICTPPTDD